MLDEAANSENKESYRVIERTGNYRIGAGAELAPSGKSLLFVEVVIRLCPDLSKVDLAQLERNVSFLKELKARGYSVLSQDDNFISCQKSLKQDDLVKEYEAIKLIAPRTC